MFKLSTVTVFLCILGICFSWPDFHLYTRPTGHFPNVSPSLLGSTFFNPQNPTVFIVHGFLSSSAATWMNEMKDNLLEKESFNVFLVDWKDGADLTFDVYIGAAQNAKVTGQRIAEFINDSSINPSSVHCIGHSLGAHACGFAGKSVKLRRISGLDPAGPLFGYNNTNQRLDRSDAEFVDVIHTDICNFGIRIPIGHQDFYPNGGNGQPSCNDNVPELICKPNRDNINLKNMTSKGDFGCSHIKVSEYYTKSILYGLDDEYLAVACSDYATFRNGTCSCETSEKCSYMGYHAIKHYYLEGKFYLRNNSISMHTLYNQTIMALNIFFLLFIYFI